MLQQLCVLNKIKFFFLSEAAFEVDSVPAGECNPRSGGLCHRCHVGNVTDR